MADDWWHRLDLSAWQAAYGRHAALRPALDRLIAERLGHEGVPPPDDACADRLLAEADRRDALCVGLGLWAMRCPDYLLLRPFRQTLMATLSQQQQTQLLALFPRTHRCEARLAPPQLATVARQSGAAWLARADEPALALCRLLWPHSTGPAPDGPVRPVLDKLVRWL
ncbi:type III secretion system (T3SS) protein LEE [Paludibacterium purpuratum]|uniref:Type III secretion system (T3SS) protein LEE n=2 Tax=Paludibacterium purpuratum TaxID=1144873 RepID=A0A4R7B123_9NEIS|nr:type III secretion system (T3SS) protein LEE [Paludibacterium purpuratum]